MKKISFLFVIFIFMAQVAQSAINTSLCPQPPYNISNTFSQVMSQISGTNFISTKAIELAAQSKLKRELGAKRPNVEVVPYSFGDLRKGKFKTISVTIPRAAKEEIAFSNFKAQSVCPFNYWIIEKYDVKFAENFLMSFSTDFTNDDIKNIISSKSYIEKLSNIHIKVGGVSFLKVIQPNVFIKNNHLNLTFGIETPLLLVNRFDKVQIASKLKVENGKIKLANMIVNNTKYDASILMPIINLLNPLNFDTQIVNNSGIAQIKNIDIINDKISLNGVLFIPKNYVIEK